MRHISTDMNNSSDSGMHLLPELYFALEAGASVAEQLFEAFSRNTDTVHTAINQVFGLELDAPLSAPLVESLQSGEVDWPQLKVVSTAQLNGANGGFAGSNNTIYVASEFLEQYQGSQARIAGLLLEEYGHALDYRFNSTDAPGDEGAIFSALVQGQELTAGQLQTLKSENDVTTVLLNGKPLQLEQDTVNVTQVLNGLDELLKTLQNALESQVFAQALPLLGDSLKDSGSDAVQFIDKLRQPIRKALEVLPEDATPEQIKSALEGALGDLIQEGINVNPATPNDVRFELKLAQLASENQTSIALDSEFGLPGLGLDVRGSANVGLGYDIDLNFGVNQDGFYFDTSGADDIVVDFKATAPARVTGKLGLLEVEIGDNGADPSSLTGKFKIDLKDDDDKLRISELASPNLSNLIDAKLDESSGADLNLELKTRVVGAEALPSIGTELNVDWALGNAIVDPSQSLENFGETPTVVYKNIQLYLDSFFDNFAGPILNTVQDILEPVQPIIDTLLTPIDLGVTKFTLLDIAKALGKIKKEDEEFLQSAASLLRLIQDLPENSEVGISLGQEFNLGDIRKPDFDRKKLTLPKFSSFDLSSQLAGREAEQSFYAGLKTHPGEGLKFPILDDPSQAFNLLLGNYDQIELFQYDLPKFDFEARYRQFFPIIGPLLGAELEGVFGATVDVDFGFDASGISNIASGGANSSFFDGFYVTGVDSSGAERPEVVLHAAINAYASVGGAAGVGGGIQANINFDLNDPTPEDGKVRYSELMALSPFNSGGEDLFKTSGELSAGLSAYIELGWEPFKYTKRWESPRQVLLDFNNKQPAVPPRMLLGTMLDDGSLRLNIGPNAADRVIENLEDGPEVFIVRDTSSQQVTIAAFDKFHTLPEPILVGGILPVPVIPSLKRIIADGGAFDDLIDLSGVSKPSEISGGEDDDELLGGSAVDVLRGDQGSDRLSGGGDNDQLFGGAGSDFLDGGAGADALDGGEGFDIATYARSSEGILLNRLTGEGTGDAEGDTFSSIEQIEGSFHADTLIGGNGADQFDGGAGDDNLQGGGGNDVLIPGYGDDTVSGGTGEDLLVIDYSTLPTAAVAWRQERANESIGGDEKQGAFFVANAYGMSAPFNQVAEWENEGFLSSKDDVKISEDGSTLAWVQNNELFVQSIEQKSPPIQLTSNDSASELPRRDNGLTLSADGSKVAWVGYDNDSPSGEYFVYVANSDGTGIQKITSTQREKEFIAAAENIEIESLFRSNIYSVTLSGDGSKVAWDSHFNGNSSNSLNASLLSVANTDGTETRRSVSRQSHTRGDFDHFKYPSLSFDGSQIAWIFPQSNSNSFRSIEKLMLASSDFSQVMEITRTDRTVGGSLLNPFLIRTRNSSPIVISKDGSQVFWQESIGGNAAAIKSSQIIDGQARRPVTHRTFDVSDGTPVSFSPNGERFGVRNPSYSASGVSELALHALNPSASPEVIVRRSVVPGEGGANDLYPSISSEVDIGVRYGSFDPSTGSGEIITWGPSHVTFDSVDRFDLTGTIYGDELYGGNLDDRLTGTSGADILKAGLGNDTYQLDFTNSGGSQIQDTGGSNDELKLSTFVAEEQLSSNIDQIFEQPEEIAAPLTLAAPASGTMGIARDGTTLLIDLNQDGTIAAEQDLTILDFFASPNDSSPGVGFIETIANVAGTSLLNALPGTGGPTLVQSNSALEWNTLTGQLSKMVIDPVTNTATLTPISRSITDTTWELQTTGDLNGDGQEDVLLRHFGVGQHLAFYMNAEGSRIESEALIGRDIPDPNWSLSGTGDIDNDGKTDIILRNQTADQIVAWYMDDKGNILRESLVGRSFGDNNWKIVSTEDFNGDGKSDILLQNQPAGQVLLWEMDGARILDESLVGRQLDSSWYVEGASDFDRNGTTDILIRNRAAGQTMLWSMANKNTVGTEALLSGVPGDTSRLLI